MTTCYSCFNPFYMLIIIFVQNTNNKFTSFSVLHGLPTVSKSTEVLSKLTQYSVCTVYSIILIHWWYSSILKSNLDKP